MRMIVELDDFLAARLSREARAQKVSVEQLTQRLLEKFVARRALKSKSWRAKNRRRVALIEKSLTTPLTSEEQAELQQLQEALEQLLEPFDRDLTDKIGQMEQEVKRLMDAGKY